MRHIRGVLGGAILASVAAGLASDAVAGTCGDADGNGMVTVTDGVLVLQAAAGLSTKCPLSVCDVDASASVTVSDGVNVLRLAAGLTASGSCVAASGDLDETFGDGGRRRIDFGAPSNLGFDYAVQRDGKVIVAGIGVHRPSKFDIRFDLGLARYRDDGSRDPDFGTEGAVLTDLGSVSEEARAIVIQADGKPVVVGFTRVEVGIRFPYHFALARYTENGSLDPSFGNGGMVTTAFPDEGNSGALAVALDRNGRLILAGVDNPDPIVGLPLSGRLALARYDASGHLDPGFGDAGLVTTDVSSATEIRTTTQALALQSDGAILVAGDAVGAGVIVRYDADGNPDASFGPGGILRLNFGTDLYQSIDALAIQGDDKILVLHNAGLQSAFRITLARLERNGTLDPSFGDGGTVAVEVDTRLQGEALALQPNGAILVGASSSQGSTIQRYQPDGRLDPSFHLNGILAPELESGIRLKLLDDGRFLALTDFFLVRYR